MGQGHAQRQAGGMKHKTARSVDNIMGDEGGSGGGAVAGGGEGGARVIMGTRRGQGVHPARFLLLCRYESETVAVLCMEGPAQQSKKDMAIHRCLSCSPSICDGGLEVPYRCHSRLIAVDSGPDSLWSTRKGTERCVCRRKVPETLHDHFAWVHQLFVRAKSRELISQGLKRRTVANRFS